MLTAYCTNFNSVEVETRKNVIISGIQIKFKAIPVTGRGGP
jgi:hypothetical protein